MTAVLFDFFGTLADYSPSRTEQGYHRSHGLALASNSLPAPVANVEMGLAPSLSYPDFLARLEAVFATFDAGDRESSMAEMIAAFLDRPIGDPAVGEFERVYLAEWAAPVTPVDGLGGLLEDLRSRGHRLAVVSNTHSPDMVPAMLAEFGVAALFDAVVLSVTVGRRKPHPAVYAAALSAMGAAAGEAVFVGDSVSADYLGPRAAGIDAYLIGEDPRVPPEKRLKSILDVAWKVLPPS